MRFARRRRFPPCSRFDDMRYGGNVCCLRDVCVPSRVRFEAVGWTLAMSVVRKRMSLNEFRISAKTCMMQIKDIGNVSEAGLSLAQIVRWEWDQKGEQEIKETKILHMGETVEFSIKSLCSIVIRILKKREKNDKNTSEDDLTVNIGDKQITVPSQWLMSVSPVINRMLSVEMLEKQQRSISFDELGVDMEQFMEFLDNISVGTSNKKILPNPKNVLLLLQLADFFQVDSLKSRCESHLINCVEIPLIDRFLLIDQYQLDHLKA
ncbi:hypothetical protein niasHT_020357 [Heterodera trifolii]|uniref:BTB domain-containing protein n=1 Tax=Heterodera trifolii TaxID=157864 RepID=A0ABD2JX34_9BILA